MLEKEFLAERLSLCTPSSVWRSQKREAFVAHSVLRGLLLIPYFQANRVHAHFEVTSIRV